jgi:hypothetical protein
MAGSRGGLFDNLNIPIHRCAAQRRHRDRSAPGTARSSNGIQQKRESSALLAPCAERLDGVGVGSPDPVPPLCRVKYLTVNFDLRRWF